MARMSIEEKWWSDERRYALSERLGDTQRADGLAIAAWHLAQKFWGHGRRNVPIVEFNCIPNSNILIDVGLAKIVGNSVYIRGTKQWHDWYATRIESSSKGGKSNRNRVKQTGSQTTKQTGSPIAIPITIPISKENREAEQSNRPQSPPDVGVDGPAAFGFVEINGKKQKLSPRVLDTWIDLYGKEFVLDELKKAGAWCLVNPRRAPKGNPARFLANWLSRGWEWHRKQIPTNKQNKTDWDELKKKAGVG